MQSSLQGSEIRTDIAELSVCAALLLAPPRKILVELRLAGESVMAS